MSDHTTEPAAGNPGPPEQLVRLDGRWVVVTGAARGIGRATALLLARAGADVALCDRDADALEDVALAVQELGRLAVVAVIDVRDRDGVARFAAEVGSATDRVHGLVNNAGGTFRAALMDSTPKGDDALMAENFTSVVSTTRAFVPLMRGHSAAVVNVTSSEAFQAAPGFGVYAAMKAAQESLTKTLALELADDGIRVNSVSPDGIPTAGDEALAEATRAASQYLPPPVPPLGFATPDACASVILFLLGDLARFVTGSAVHVDGGLHAAGGWHRRPET